MVGNTLHLDGGDDGSGHATDWPEWSRSVADITERVTDPENWLHKLGTAGLSGTIELSGDVSGPMRVIADRHMQEALGDLGLGRVSMN